MISAFCVKRPIFAVVMSMIIVIGGGVAMFALPIAQYPDITPPQVTVSATYAGADSDTVAQTVAAPIETQVNGADNMIYMQSTSSPTGSMTLNVYFDIGTDPDTAQVQVQNRVNLALPQLREAVQKTGINVEKRSTSFLLLIGIYSPDGRFDQQYINNYANLYVLDAIKRVNRRQPGADHGLGGPRHAHLAAAGPHGGARHHQQGRAERGAEPERAVRRRQRRPVAERQPGGAVVPAGDTGPADHARAVREHHPARRCHGRRHRAAAGCLRL